MKPNPQTTMRRRTKGSALLTVIVFTAIGAMLVGSVLFWASTHNQTVQRRFEFARAQYAAEAGVDKVFAQIRASLFSTGQAPNQSDCNKIATNAVPVSSDSAQFADYRYLNINGQPDRLTVSVVGSPSVQPITSGTLAGLNALIMPYQIVSRVSTVGRPVSLTTGIQRDLQIQSIPIFQFAIFYDLDMEIENGPPMTVNGKVHSNRNAFLAPGSTLTFQDNVTVVNDLFNNPMPGDTHQSSWIAPTYETPPIAGASPLNLPIHSSNPHDLIELPPSSGTDPLENDRFHNLAGLRIKVKDNSIEIEDSTGQSVFLPSSVINTNKTFFNFRENKTISVTEIDIGKLIDENKVPANRILYVADVRSKPQTAVRLVNGDTLPERGLTVASANPVYLKGNYNTATQEPAAIFADAINILSGNWNDANSAQSLNKRVATDTTVNAAFFTGIVPTEGSDYSGGVENLPRFLEKWSGKTFEYNGSMVVMFESEIAVGKWRYGGNYYTAPVRDWAFDVQFLDPTRLPPGTPSVRTLRRTTWKSVL